MTPTFRVVGDQLQEQPRMKEPTQHPWTDNTGDSYQRDKNTDEWERYNAHVASMRKYTIRPSDWEGITEVNEGEFEVKYERLYGDGVWRECNKVVFDVVPEECRLLAVPLRPAGKGQEGMITLSRKELEELWDAARNHTFAEEYGRIPNRFPNRNHYIDKLIHDHYTITLNKQ